MNIFIVTALVMTTLFILLVAAAQFLYRDKITVNRRMGRLTSGSMGEVVVKKKNKMKRERRVDTKLKIFKSIASELSLSGVLIRPSEYLVIWSLISLVPSSIALIISRDIIVALAFLLVGLFLPPFFLHRKKIKQVELFEKQLPDAVAVICNCLRSGLTFNQAIESIANEMPEPISKEFARVLRELKLGITFDKALNHMGERLGSKDFLMIVSAVLIQRQTGGNLSDILFNIATTIKERYKVKSEIKVLTTTGRTSGMVIGFMPIFILLFFMLLNPEYVRGFFDTTAGVIMLIAAGVLELIGYLFIKKIVNIKF